MKIGNKNFDTNQTYIMGILNVTPDSFSDGGKYDTTELAVKHALQMSKEGASIIDIGGESTRPGASFVPAYKEIERICPVIEKIKQETDIPISVDTYKGEVASAALSCGADLINDIWGLQYDSKMAAVIAQAKVPCCLMHNRSNLPYNSFLEDWLSDIEAIIKHALSVGIQPSNIILDPGIGFAKTYEENLLAMKHLSMLHKFGYPILLGTSNKSMIGNALNVPVTERLNGTLATTAYGYFQHMMFIRVHHVQANYEVLRMLQTIQEV